VFSTWKNIYIYKSRKSIGMEGNYFFKKKKSIYLEALLMRKMVPGEAKLVHKVMPGAASTLMMECQSWKYALCLKQVGHLVEHLGRMPWKETASRETHKESL
jgi:hypothetical protein